MRKNVLIVIFAMFFMVGCGSINNVEVKKSSPVEISKAVTSLKTYDWNHARIKNKVPVRYFGNAPIVVQNEKYIFYPKEGNKVVRVGKRKKDEKIIYEFPLSKEKGVGVHLTLGENIIFFEHEGNIVSSDYNGDNVVEIISNSKMKKRLSKEIEDLEDFCEIYAIHYYKKNLYFISRFNIYEYDMKTEKITRLADDVYEACFCGNMLYCAYYSWTALCEVNLSTHKKKRIRGKETNIKEVKNTGAVKYYRGLMEVDNQFYYVRRQNAARPAIYQYCKNGKDKKIYEYEVSPGMDFDEIPVCDSSKIACAYTDREDGEHKAMIYDIKARTLKKTDLSGERFNYDFIIENLVFYWKGDSDYISCFSYE